MAVCLVTGGAGFLGSHLVEALVRDNHIVRVLDNFTSGSLANLGAVIDDIEFHPGDFLNSAFLSRAMRGVELVFHFGGQTPLDGHSRQASGIARGVLHVLYAALEARVRRLLVASSMEVYGPFRHQPVEETDPTEPLSPHGRALLSGELACAICTKMSGLETVRLRYFNIFGPRQPADSPYAAGIRNAVHAMASGCPPEFDGDDRSKQDLIYVEDAVHATLLAARAPRVSGKVYNIARGQPIPLTEVADTINHILGTCIEPLFTGKRLRGSLDLIGNTRRAEVELGFCAATDLRRALIRYLEAKTQMTAFTMGNTFRPTWRQVNEA
jgi:UDP-glucose 4-epimerase